MTDPLFVDVYAGDGPKDWAAFCAAGAPWHGAIFKCSQGTYYRPTSYVSERSRFVSEARCRLGVDLWEGAYHYLDLSIDGAAQAEYAVKSAGPRGPGTLWVMVDVERGGQRVKEPSRALVQDCVSSFAARYTAITGRMPTLYGGELLRSVGISSRLGCGRSAVALYGGELHGPHESTLDFLRRTGTDVDHLFLWQYSGTAPQSTVPRGYPIVAPGCGRVDISAMVLPGGLEALRSALAAG